MISYHNINESIKYYESKGFQRIESPWTVTEAVSAMTRPLDRQDWTISNKDKVLVASGEQSFLYLHLKGFLPSGKFQTVTPCFRDDQFDLTHTKYFMKNELIITDESLVGPNNLWLMVQDARWFFADILNLSKRDFDDSRMLSVVETGENAYDIMYNGTELGSYGIRETEIMTYIYGTACAEPRLSGSSCHKQ